MSSTVKYLGSKVTKKAKDMYEAIKNIDTGKKVTYEAIKNVGENVSKKAKYTYENIGDAVKNILGFKK